MPFLIGVGRIPSLFTNLKLSTEQLETAITCPALRTFAIKNKKRPACILAEGAYNLYGQSPF